MKEPAEAPRYPRVTLAAACVPWDERGDVMDEVFREQVRLHLAAGVKHIYIFGTAGEGYAVTESLFDEIVHLFTDEMRRDPEARPMIGLISLSMRTTIERIERCLDQGLRTFQFALPVWGALNDNELATFFREVLGRVMRKKGLARTPEEQLHRVIGDTIRNLRKEKDLTLKQMSRRRARIRPTNAVPAGISPWISPNYSWSSP